MKWSQYQEAVFDHCVLGTGNAIVEAVAGSGKTTTIVEALNRITTANPFTTTLFLAFNKSIAEELKSRGVNARTFHSLTYGPVTQFKKTRTVTSNKTDKIIDMMMSGQQIRIYAPFVRRLVSLAKQCGMGCLNNGLRDDWYAIVDHYDLEVEHQDGDIEQGIDFAIEILNRSNDSSLVDFDDLLYTAVFEGISLSKYDFVFVDEAQDTNAIQRALLKKVLKPNGRIVAVGDPCQAIYGFRGSDSDSMNVIAEEFQCERLPLTVSYRCPKKIVEHAHQWVDHIEAHDSAPEGELEDVKLNKGSVAAIEPGNMIVCRTNKPLFELAYKMIQARNTAPQIVGRDIAQGLKSTIQKMKAKGIDALRDKLNTWCDRECEKANARGAQGKAQAIEDRVDVINFLIDTMDENHRTVPELLRIIDDLFADKAKSAKLCTIHKAKGLEADTVYWLKASECPAQWAKLEWEKEQEKNLCYVATTRAKNKLIFIE